MSFLLSCNHILIPSFRENRESRRLKESSTGLTESHAKDLTEEDEECIQKVKTKMGHIDKEMPSRASKCTMGTAFNLHEYIKYI